jgi:DNA (cytosine-5)-methyltransferase 1
MERQGEMSARRAKFQERQALRPPYRAPSMEEINALEPNGFKVVSTFAGGGGSSLGYRMAGFQILWVNEFIEAARETYAANARPYTIIDGRDIRTVEAADILKATGLAVGELDVFDGSPPCASFSTSGKREKGWGKVKAYSDGAQRSDDLFFEFARLLEGLQPKVFVAENVSGLVKGTAKGYFKLIHRRLEECGYRVQARLLNAKWLGVPQSRERTIFVGVRRDLNMSPAHPTPLPYVYTVRDALPWLRSAVHDTSGAFSSGPFTDKPCPAITVGVNSVNSRHYQVAGPEPEPETDISRYEIGAEWGRIGLGEASAKIFQFIRSHPDKPAQTVTACGGRTSTACIAHPYERRKFSIAELKRICGFPDDFIAKGTYAQQWERLGRAVPPMMMSHIAATIRDEILRKL